MEQIVKIDLPTIIEVDEYDKLQEIRNIFEDVGLSIVVDEFDPECLFSNIEYTSMTPVENGKLKEAETQGETIGILLEGCGPLACCYSKKKPSLSVIKKLLIKYLYSRI